METEAAKLNLRSIYFTDAFREKLQCAQPVIRSLRSMGVRVLRTDYSDVRPLIEIDPLTAKPVEELQVSMMSTGNEPGGMRRISKVIGGCEVVWHTA